MGISITIINIIIIIIIIIIICAKRAFPVQEKRKIEEISVGNQMESLLSFHSHLSFGNTFE